MSPGRHACIRKLWVCMACMPKQSERHICGIVHRWPEDYATGLYNSRSTPVERVRLTKSQMLDVALQLDSVPIYIEHTYDGMLAMPDGSVVHDDSPITGGTPLGIVKDAWIDPATGFVHFHARLRYDQEKIPVVLDPAMGAEQLLASCSLTHVPDTTETRVRPLEISLCSVPRWKGCDVAWMADAADAEAYMRNYGYQQYTDICQAQSFDRDIRCATPPLRKDMSNVAEPATAAAPATATVAATAPVEPLTEESIKAALANADPTIRRILEQTTSALGQLKKEKETSEAQRKEVEAKEFHRNKLELARAVRSLALHTSSVLNMSPVATNEYVERMAKSAIVAASAQSTNDRLASIAALVAMATPPQQPQPEHPAKRGRVEEPTVPANDTLASTLFAAFAEEARGAVSGLPTAQQSLVRSAVAPIVQPVAASVPATANNPQEFIMHIFDSMSKGELKHDIAGGSVSSNRAVSVNEQTW
jgi:hypothetical protein